MSDLPDEYQTHAPVRMVWKADSTFEASSAEVSMNDNPFSANLAVRGFIGGRGNSQKRTSKRLRLFRRDRSQVLQIALVADEHDDDVRVRMVAQLLQPACDVDVGRVFGDIIHE